MMRNSLWGLMLGATALLAPELALAFGSCPPDGDETLWPTASVDERCGSYQQCEAFVQANRPQDALACNQKIDKCAVALHQANAKAELHNTAVENCRASLPAQPKPAQANPVQPKPMQVKPSHK